MSAVSMIITEATQSNSKVNEINVGNKVVIFESGEYITFSLISKSSKPTLKQVLARVVRKVEDHYEELNTWNGNLDKFSNISTFFSSLSLFMIDMSHINKK